MPEEPFAPEEAFEFLGVEVPATKEESERAEREMAECFIEEYVRMGYSPELIMGLCRNPFYRGLHAIWQRSGDAYVQTLIDSVVRQWRPSTSARDATPSGVEGRRPRSAPSNPLPAGTEAPTEEKRDAEGL